MRFTDLFVKRPVLAIVVNLVILIAGLQSIRALSVRQYPRSDIAIVRVSTVYVGANAPTASITWSRPAPRGSARSLCI
jgi:multidrug efflux pump